MIHALLLFFIIFSPLTKAANQFEHEIKGCPHNSECNEQMGSFLLQLEKSFKDKNHINYLKKNGVPFELWLTDKSYKNYKGAKAVWDNHCHTNASNVTNEIGIVITKNLKDVINNKSFLTRRALVDYGNNKYVTFHMPRAHLPLYMDGNSLVFQKNLNNRYYNIAVNAQNKIKILASYTPKYFSETVVCPKKLQEAFKMTEVEKTVMKGVMCQKVWNRKANKYYTYITGWDCH